jgi:hypothetical protein
MLIVLMPEGWQAGKLMPWLWLNWRIGRPGSGFQVRDPGPQRNRPMR